MPNPRPHPYGSRRNILNALICLAVPWPSIVYTIVLSDCPASAPSVSPWALGAALSELCAYGVNHPLWTVNILFFLNVCVLFWLISLAQRSTWLIDPYWTILPVLIGHFFQVHPQATADPWRAAAALAVLWLWSIRLTGNYFRREEWRFGWREDWRFTQMREEWAGHWWWKSFFAVYLSQQVMLVGLCLPLYAVFSRDRPFGILDGIATIGALAGIAIAHVADTQLRRFVLDNRARRARGEEPQRLLDEGLWRYARHPNYFGELSFWWSLGLFGLSAGAPWTLAGAAINTLVMARVTVLTEQRMTERSDRAALYRDYQRRTSAWIPWPKRQ